MKPLHGRIRGQAIRLTPWCAASWWTRRSAHWPRYAVAFALMGVAAAGTALTAYLLGTMTNEAYVNHNYHAIVVIGLLAMVIFALKGLATYGATVMLSWIGNRIIADNQRRMFDKLLAAEHRLLRRPPLVRIHCSPHHRRHRRQRGDQSADHRHRPRSDVAHRALVS